MSEDAKRDALGPLHELYELARADLAAGHRDAVVEMVQLATAEVLWSIERGEVCAEWAAKEFVTAWYRYENCEVESLGEALGAPAHTHRQAKKDNLRAWEVWERVRALRATGAPLRDNNSAQRGAYAQAGEEFGFSPSKVEKMIARLMRAESDDRAARLEFEASLGEQESPPQKPVTPRTKNRKK